MKRTANLERETTETQIRIALNLDGSGQTEIDTGIAFLDHMLTLWSVHGFFDLKVKARGDLEVDFHHTVEDIGIVLGDVLTRALGERRGIVRYGQAVTPMDETLTSVSLDLSNRPYLVYNVPTEAASRSGLDLTLAKEFFRAIAVHGGITLHINVAYGENEHHIIESIFKAFGRALDLAVSADRRITGVRSSKGAL